MRPRWGGGLRGVFLFMAFLCPSGQSNVEALDQCLTELKGVQNRFLSRIPTAFLTLDGNLLRIAQGVRFIDENAKLLAEKGKEQPVPPNYALLLSNSVEGCHSYVALFESRLRFYFIFVVCLIVTGVLLTVSLGFNMVPLNSSGGQRRGKSKSSDSGPVDKLSGHSDKHPSRR